MINSHYVPQFILRNFYSNDKITYCDLEKKKVELRNTRSVFSEDGYYPEGIEKDLCKKAEYLFANLYHNKLESARNNITLTLDDMFVIKKYLIVCAIRYKRELTETDKQIIRELGPSFQVDYDRSLNEILACEKSDDLFEKLNSVPNKLIDYLCGNGTTKMDDNIFLWAEMKDILSSYLIFVKTRGDEKFIIPDIGRAICEGPIAYKKVDYIMDIAFKTLNPQLIEISKYTSARDYTYYPLSRNLAVISINAFYKLFTDSGLKVNIGLPPECPTLSKALGFGDRNAIKPPKVKGSGKQKEFNYEIKYLTTQDVCHFNSLVFTEAKRFVAFGELSDIQNSIEYAKDYTQRDLTFLRV